MPRVFSADSGVSMSAALARFAILMPISVHLLAIMLHASLVHRRNVVPGARAPAQSQCDGRRHPCRNRFHPITPEAFWTPQATE
ncbi:MAG: hypothetical protein AB7H66_10510 [Hyphomonadaceae bacterium]